MTGVRDRVKDLLDSLGATADEVANSLRTRGISGTPEDPCHCPIANLIRSVFPESDAQGWTYDPDGDPGWFVSGTEVWTCDGRIKPPYPVAEFIEHFDGYPASLRYDDLRAEQ
jgi:hypothetical protein